jgi:hypothetical protein
MPIRTKPLHSICERQLPADPQYIDLGPFYNFAMSEEINGKPGNTIPLPAGVKDYKGVKFDVRGILQLESSVSYTKSNSCYPRAVSGIPVARLAESICFLHSSAWESKMGTEVVNVVFNYANNQIRTITLKNQIEIADWWFHLKFSIFPPSAQLA